jgi:hypothetical protein
MRGLHHLGRRRSGDGKQGVPGGKIIREHQLLPEFGFVADDQRSSQIGGNPTRIIRGNGQDHNQRQFFSLRSSNFRQGIGGNVDILAWMKQGWIHDHKRQRWFFDRLKPLEGGLGVMIQNDIPPLLRKTEQSRRKRQDAFVADFE